MLVHPKGETIEEGTLNDGTALPRPGEASSSKVVVDVSLSAGDTEKVIAEADTRSDSDMYLHMLRMINEGPTQLEVRMEGALGLL